MGRAKAHQSTETLRKQYSSIIFIFTPGRKTHYKTIIIMKSSDTIQSLQWWFVSVQQFQQFNELNFKHLSNMILMMWSGTTCKPRRENLHLKQF